MTEEGRPAALYTTFGPRPFLSPSRGGPPTPLKQTVCHRLDPRMCSKWTTHDPRRRGSLFNEGPVETNAAPEALPSAGTLIPMGFEAHPVTKQRWPDLVELFDRPIVRTCFCMFYRKVGAGTGVGQQNRRAMKALVDRGSVPGLIGYDDGVPVAWVSLGPREDYAKLRRSPVMKPVDDQPV